MGFRRQLFIGYAASLAIAALATSVAVVALRISAHDSTRLARRYADELVQVERLRLDAEGVIAAARGYLVSRDARARDQLSEATSSLQSNVEQLQSMGLSADSNADLSAVANAARDYAEIARGIANEDTDAIAREMEQIAGPDRAALQERVRALARRERASFEHALARARDHAGTAGLVVGLVGGLGLALSALLAAVVIRRLARQHAADRAATVHARRATAAREEVLAVVSHDLRNPLATIVTASDLLALRVHEPGARRQLDILQFAADRMTHMLDEISDLVRLDAGVLQLDLCRYDITKLLRDVADQFAGAAAKQSVRLECSAPAQPAFANVDVERLVRVLSNLLGNALKFTPAGGVIRLGAQVSTGRIAIAVEDSGIGIPGEQLDHVFERHWRGDGARASRGLGLGLYICKRLVEAHRGRISVTSQRGEGACFELMLPLAETDAAG